MVKKIYFAGPDVFFPNYPEKIREIQALGAKYNFSPLCPGESPETDPTVIYQKNLALIEEAHGLIANLNPFRGQEPDSGTAFEVGYALAKGKWIIGYLTDLRDLKTKIHSKVKGPQSSVILPDGSIAEDFGLPVNLTLALAAKRLVPNLEAAVLAAVAFKLLG
jgi:nucleoside 2-deoxyribosyltransferase